MELGLESILETVLVGSIASLSLLSLLFLFFGHVLRLETIRRIARFALYEEQFLTPDELKLEERESHDKHASFGFLLIIALLYGLGATFESVTHDWSWFIDKDIKATAFEKVGNGQVQGQTAPLDFSRFVTDEAACLAVGIPRESAKSKKELVPSPCQVVYAQEREYYYTAKNAVVQKESYAHELATIESRIDFVRAACLSLLLLTITTLLATLIGSGVELRDKIRKWRRLRPIAVDNTKPSLEQHWRELAAVRCLLITLVLGGFAAAALQAWHLEERQYARRIFGYYLALMGGRRAEPPPGPPAHEQKPAQHDEQKPAQQDDRSHARPPSEHGGEVVLAPLPTSPYRVFSAPWSTRFEPSAVQPLDGGKQLIVTNDHGGATPFLLFTFDAQGIHDPHVLAIEDKTQEQADQKDWKPLDLKHRKIEALLPLPDAADGAGAQFMAIVDRPAGQPPRLATFKITVDAKGKMATATNYVPLADPCDVAGVKAVKPTATSCSIEGAALRGDSLLLGVRYLRGPEPGDHKATLVIVAVSRSGGTEGSRLVALPPPVLADVCSQVSGVSDIQAVGDDKLLVLTSFELWKDERCRFHKSQKTLAPIAEVGGALWLVNQRGSDDASEPKLLQRFAHKPEGLTILPDGRALVVFDDDAKRKSVSLAPDTFPLEQNQSVFAIVDVDH